MADIIVAGNTSGAITISAPLVAGSGTLTLPVATDTLVGKATTDTLTNKTLGAGTVMPAGSVLQVVNSQTGAVATGTTLIPTDDTIPQITEGNEYMTLAITPKSATSILQITVTANISVNGAQRTTVALFRDAVANSLAAAMGWVSLAGTGITSTFSHTMVSGGTTQITFRVRAGSEGASTMTFNGHTSARVYGGVMASSITITEYAV